jgi:TldD protein
MNSSMKLLLRLAFSVMPFSPLAAQAVDDPLLNVVETELKREWAEFGKLSQPPYFMSYAINDIHSASITSSFGSLTGSLETQGRLLLVDVKVGDYEFDSSHPLKNYGDIDLSENLYGRGFGTPLPIDTKKEAIQYHIWKNSERAYKSALETYKALKNAPVSTNKKTVPDFSKEIPSVYVDGPLPEFASLFDKSSWEKRIKTFTAPFLSNNNIVNSDASLEVGTERKYFISSEGSKIVQNRTYAYLSIAASVRAVDGDIVPLNLSYFAFNPADLPADDAILKDVKTLITKLEILRTAPVAEPYTGPAILHARAAGVFFHEIFGHRVEGHRLKSDRDGQTFKEKVNQIVLPKSLSVISNPTLSEYKGQALNGYYQFDDEGVKGQKVTIVENGILKTFLMSRSPIENHPNSNGHGRAQAGASPVTRQSNLLIENKKEVPMSELRKMLISECRKEKKPYGYLFMDVMGGFTTTERTMPNAFNIFPTEVYRVYVDGRPDELVRGVDLIGTPLAMFAGIVAADNKSEVFTGYCGAESGSVPVTAISPSLYVRRIETQRKATMEIEPTILDRPQPNTESIK